MGEVVHINNIAGKGDQPHLTGDAICSACRKEWTGVVPVGTTELECPDCHTMKGLFKHHLSPITTDLWRCHCGGELFFLIKKEVQCCNCGITTPITEIY